MLDIKFIRNNMDFVRGKMAERRAVVALDRFSELDAGRRDLLLAVENLRSERNTVSKEIGARKKNNEDSSSLLSAMAEVSARIKELDDSLKNIEAELGDFALTIPNIPDASVVCGAGAEDNPVVRTWGEKPAFDFPPRPHWEIGESLGILDFARGAKITGARFTLYRGWGATLERALINFMLDLHTADHGYTEVLPPFLVNRESMTATGQLPKFAEDLFKIEGMDYFLIPTAEVPVTNIHRDEILEEQDLPLYYAAWSACFRAEAGSYGKDTRGLIRQHQFNKVELVKFTTPETSNQELEKLTANAEDILKRLAIPFRRSAYAPATWDFRLPRLLT
jgi:seryl-tRNA synthetase